MWRITMYLRMRMAVVAAFVVTMVAANALVSAQPTGELQHMIEISWSRGSDLPQGFQDSTAGVLDGYLITAVGFCQGEVNVPGKSDKYPRGFLKKVWGLQLSNPATGWMALPDFPGDARQEVFGVVVGDAFYCWGGFSYEKPLTYKDGYRLSKSGDKWTWEKLPDLPWPICSAGIVAIGSKIYVVGGSQYDGNGFYTQFGPQGEISRVGSRLVELDTADLTGGWRELAPCPGTPRWSFSASAVNGNIYVFGGGSGNDNATGSYGSIVDNWMYNPAGNEWTRLADLPVSSGNFAAGPVVFNDQYILLIGGYQYPKILNPDGSVRDAYGRAAKHYPAPHEYFSDMFVYDTRSGTYGDATPLPLNNNRPAAVILKDKLYLIGGETGGAVVDGEHYGHHPDLLLVGDLHLIKP
ncbi:MAG: hypothetical protein IT448_09685 [Phycisphaerales bacterium]|nr:hypothetical protein [Phycisphaerales bacterium]